MPVRRRKTLLVDLDGTLVDPARGIIGCIRFALEMLGSSVTEDADLRWTIGPPLRVSFSKLLADDRDVEKAIGFYRQRYAEEGLYLAERYPDIFEVLQARADLGSDLILCTSKPTPFARRVVVHFGFEPLFRSIYGSDLDGRLDNKADLIEHILRTEELSPDMVCMVGDREHDVLGAARHGVPTVGVLWGYGSRAELTDAGAAAIIKEPIELLE